MAITPVVVPLSEPIEYNKKTYSELSFSRTMLGKDMVAMDAIGQGVTRKTYALYASMSETPFGVFLDMTVDDLELVAQAVAGLTGKSSREAEESPAKE